jgi:transposase
MRKHYTETQRGALLDLVAKGRTSLRAAAAQLEVAESTAYYWLKQARRQRSAVALVARGSSQREAVMAPRFARLVRAGDAAAAITLRIGTTVIEVRPGFDAALLREVVAALAEAAS